MCLSTCTFWVKVWHAGSSEDLFVLPCVLRWRQHHHYHQTLSSISLMVVHYCIIYHGIGALHGTRSAHYVTSRYGQALVVFDGNSDIPSPKDFAHIGKNCNHKGTLIHFKGEMAIQIRKEDFPSNKQNKQHFITKLSERLGAHGCDVRHAATGADLLIVQTAISVSAIHNTILIGDNTDLLVLLSSRQGYHKSHLQVRT